MAGVSTLILQAFSTERYWSGFEKRTDYLHSEFFCLSNEYAGSDEKAATV